MAKKETPAAQPVEKPAIKPVETPAAKPTSAPVAQVVPKGMEPEKVDLEALKSLRKPKAPPVFNQ